jgi:F-type H+-transporting ATPase subunit b
MLSINFSELIWTIINFFLLYFLLKRFLYDPITRFMDARRERLDEALEKEREAQARVAENDEQIEQEKELRRAEAKKLIAEAAEADKSRSAEAAKAERVSDRAAMAETEERLAAESEREKAELDARTKELAAALAQQLLHGEQDA